MKIRKFNENIDVDNLKYLDNPMYECPVCGEKEKIRVWSSSLEDIEMKYIDDKFFIDHECLVCKFQWFLEFEFTSCSDVVNGEEIIAGHTVPDESYDKIIIATKKFNI